MTQDTAGIHQAALELMVESLREEETDRVVSNLLDQGASIEQIENAGPRRNLTSAYYDFAIYLIRLRGLLDSGVKLEVLADEAEGLLALEAARQQFERGHPRCPQCLTRQYSAHPLFCRNRKCHADFRRKN